MRDKYFGTTGKILRVDLDNNEIRDEFLDESVLRKYLGGTSLGVKFLFDEVNPGINWSDPENRFFLGSGPLGGTRIPGSGSFSVVTKGAMTNGVASTQANGYFGAYLKFSGYDGILIQGAASDWKYLYIHDGNAEIKDARHLLGQTTWETEESIEKELGHDQGISVASVGPAGENLVRFAGIFADQGHSASHNGVGAVMGSKKLKAIAVSRSDKRIDIADEDSLKGITKEILGQFKQAMGGNVFNYGTSNAIIMSAQAGILPVKNYTTNIFPEFERFYTRDRFELFRRPCWACSSHHVMHTRVTEGPYEGFYGKDPEYEQSAGFGPLIGNTDPGAMVMLANEGDRLGLEANEVTWTIGWVMECYEKGILSSKDLDGLEMTWGNVEATRTLLNNIAHRQGFGEILAEGVKRASKKVGGEALRMAIYTEKGNTPRTHDHRTKWWEMLDTCVSESATLQNQLLLLDLTQFGLESSFDQHSWNTLSKVVGKTTGSLTFVDSLVICFFTCHGNIPLLTRALNAATGWDMTFEESLKVGRRAVNLMRIFNIKCGLTPDKEQPSERYGSIPVDGPSEGLSIEPHWNDMVGKYYELMGWNSETGLPFEKTLTELDLEDVAKNLV
ncbi:aldehyde ferredoxin oxidoreductase family protein [Thermodesulfobacteriota bacterium]